MTTTVDRRVVEIDVRTARDMHAEMKRTANAVAGLEKGFSSLKGVIAEFGAGLVAGLSVGAFVSSIKSGIEAMDEMGKRSQRLGVTTEALSALTYQAQLAGISAEELDTGIVKLNQGLADLGKKSTESTNALQRLGVVAGTDTETALAQIADTFASIPDDAEKTALAIDLFGRSGAKLIPMLNQGAEGMEAFRKEAERLGIIVSKESAAAAEQFLDNVTRLQAGIKGTSLQIAQGLVPALTQVTNALEGSTESGERMKSMGEGLGIIIKIATGTFILFSGALQKVGTFMGAWAAGIAAIARGELRSVVTIIREASSEMDKINDDMASALEKLNAPVAVAAAPSRTGKLGRGPLTEAELKAQKKAVEDNNKAWVAMIDTWIAAEAAEGKAANEGKSMIETLEAEQKILDDLTGRAAAKKLAEQFELLDRALQDGRITFEEYAAGLRRITKATDSTTNTMTDQWLEMGKAIQQSIEGWSSEAADAVLNFATGAEQSVSGMVEGIIRQFAKLALQKLVFDQLFSAFGGWVGGMMGAADGAAFGSGGRRLALAQGGVVSGPASFAFAGGVGVMGEAGPEAVMPLKRTATGQLGVVGAGGDVTVNVINQAGAEVDVRSSKGPDGEREVTVMIQRAVADGFARGKFDGVMGATYGVSRRGR